MLLEKVIETAGGQILQKTFVLSSIILFESLENPKYSHTLLLALGWLTRRSYGTSAIAHKSTHSTHLPKWSYE